MDFHPLKVIFETTQYDFTIHIFVNYFQNINFVAAMKVIFAKEGYDCKQHQDRLCFSSWGNHHG